MPWREARSKPSVHLFVLTAATYLVFGMVVITWLPVMALLVVLTRPFDRNRRIAGRFLRLGAVLIARSFPPWRIRVEGRWPADGRAYVVVANHLSHADILLLSHLPREMKWMARVTGFRLPVVGWLFRLAGDLPVHQGDSSAGLRTLRRARDYLRRGMSVMIFPEGKRSRGTLLPFRSGAFRLAFQSGTPILPVAISGTEQALPPSGLLLRPAVLTARILDVVELVAFEDHGRLREEVRRRIAEATHQAPPPTARANTFAI